MWIWLSLAALAAAAAVAVALSPVLVRVRFRLTGGRQDARFDLFAFGGRLHRWLDLPRVTRHSLRHFAVRRRMRSRATGTRRTRLGRRPARWLRWFGSFPRALVETLAGRVDVHRLRLRGSLGVGDAAATAVAYGAAWAFLGGLLGASHAYVGYSCNPDVRFAPDFSHRRLRLDLDCILATRVADIIIAVCLALLHGQLTFRGLSIDNPGIGRRPGERRAAGRRAAGRRPR